MDPRVRIVTAVFVCGPFRSEECQLDAVYAPERFPFDLRDQYDGVEGRIGWRDSGLRKVQFSHFEGLGIMLTRLFRVTEEVTAYIYGTIVANCDCRAAIRLRSDDAVKLWVGDQLVHRHDCWRSLEGGEDRIEGVTLRKGFNPFLCKVVNGTGEWGMAMSIAEVTPIAERLSPVTPMECLGQH